MTHTPLTDALTREQLRKTVEEIREYAWDDDPGERIAAGLNDRFWRTITEEDDPPEEWVRFEALSDDFTERIGYETDTTEESSLPWWLDSFEWKFKMTGKGVLTVGGDSDQSDTALQDLEEYDPETTRVHKPELDTEEGRQNLKKLVNGLSELADKISEQSTIDRDKVSVDEKRPLPDRVFEIPDQHSESDSIVTTEEFNDWLTGLLELCPPFHPTTTALLWYNTGLPEHAVEDLGLDVELLKEAGLEDENALIRNDDYREAFYDKIMSFQGIFDRFVSAAREDTVIGYGLEAAYIHSWAEDERELSDREIKALRICAETSKRTLNNKEQEYFARCCLTLPVYFAHRNKWNNHHVSIGLDTQNVRPNLSGRLSKPKINQETRAANIITALETEYELLPEEVEDDE